MSNLTLPLTQVNLEKRLDELFAIDSHPIYQGMLYSYLEQGRIIMITETIIGPTLATIAPNLARPSFLLALELNQNDNDACNNDSEKG